MTKTELKMAKIDTSKLKELISQKLTTDKEFIFDGIRLIESTDYDENEETIDHLYNSLGISGFIEIMPIMRSKKLIGLSSKYIIKILIEGNDVMIVRCLEKVSGLEWYKNQEFIKNIKQEYKNIQNTLTEDYEYIHEFFVAGDSQFRRWNFSGIFYSEAPISE